MDENGAAANVSADDFAALESKVLQTVELIKREREARTAAEAERDDVQQELKNTREQLDAQAEQTAGVQRELAVLYQEREGVQRRVEHMLQSMDELLS